MRLTVIGNSGSYPGPHSSASCYLLEAELHGRTWRVLLDMGNGALGSLQYAQARERLGADIGGGTPTRPRSTGCSSRTCTPTTASTCAATT